MPAPIGYDSIKLAPVTADLFRVPASGPSGPVIGLREGQVLTDFLTLSLPYRGGAPLVTTTRPRASSRRMAPSKGPRPTPSTQMAMPMPR